MDVDTDTLYSQASYFEVFGPKDHIICGFWAILSLRDMDIESDMDIDRDPSV